MNLLSPFPLNLSFLLIGLCLFGCGVSSHKSWKEPSTDEEKAIVVLLQEKLGSEKVFIQPWEPGGNDLIMEGFPKGYDQPLIIFKFLGELKSSAANAGGLAAYLEGEIEPLDASARVTFPQGQASFTIQVKEVKLRNYLDGTNDEPPLVRVFKKKG